MHNKAKSTPKDVFSYLLVIAMFYASVVSFIALLFQYINVFFPDKLDFYYTGAMDSMRRSISVLVIVWPVYIFMSWMLIKEMIKRPEKRKIKVRKWLIFLTLFIAAITIIIDLVTLVYIFLGGELTIKFFLKLLVVLLVAAFSFVYYLWDLKRESSDRPKILKIIAIATSSIIIISIVGGFFVVGSPSTQREYRFDKRRINDLQVIQSETVNYWRNKNSLPQGLEDLENSISGFAPPADPKTGDSYEYIVIDLLNFDLCAVFGRSNLYDSGEADSYVSPRYYKDHYRQNWSHEAGRTCFRRTIDPDMYKEFETIRVPMPVKD